MITLLSSGPDTSCDLGVLKERTEEVCKRHQASHRLKRTRCRINCVINALNMAVQDEEPVDAQFQCDVCCMIFDTYASAFLHTC